MLAHGSIDRQSWLWHRRLGHPSHGYLKQLFPKFSSSHLQCDTCVLAKSHRQSFPSNNTHVEHAFSLIHSDVWGPAPVSGSSGFKYFVLFIDDCTRMTWIYFLKHKSEVFDKFVHFYHLIQTQFQKQIQILRSDNGGEFVNKSMQKFFSEHGLIHQTTCPNTPQQNGVAERKNRFLLEITRALMLESHVPTSFWPEAVATATYLANRLPTKILNFRTPIQTLADHTRVPPALALTPRIFDCSVFVHIPKKEHTKLDPCAEKCVFVGYGVHQKGYRCYNPQTHHMYTTMDCDFLETEYYYSGTNQPTVQGESTSGEEPLDWLLDLPFSSIIDQDGYAGADNGVQSEPDMHTPSRSPSSDIPEVSSSVSGSNHTVFPTASFNHENAESVPIESDPPQQTKYVLPPRSTRGVPPRQYISEHKPGSSRYPVANLVRGSLTDTARAFVAAIYADDTPKTVEEAMKNVDWRNAMHVEMSALEKNGTWEKCILPAGKKTVGV